ncbi:MAG: 50S ribosomal protein L4 [Chloroflexi bacterium]|nr:50S ribosomal protein L4 [Chloroflexota bacterium]
MQVPVYNLAGKELEKIEVNEQVFGVPFNQAVVHQVMVAQQANARQGTASTKNRRAVTGSTRKLFRQKGTGSGRAGSITSPLRRGGGIIFGPSPRSYRQELTKKMRRLALRCVLSAKVRDQELMVLEELNFAEPKTRQMAEVLAALGVSSSAIIVTADPEENVVKSARNLPGIKIMPASLMNVVDILSCKMILITVAAVRKAEKLWGDRLSKGGSNAPLPGIASSSDN